MLLLELHHFPLELHHALLGAAHVLCHSVEANLLREPLASFALELLGEGDCFGFDVVGNDGHDPLDILDGGVIDIDLALYTGHFCVNIENLGFRGLHRHLFILLILLTFVLHFCPVCHTLYQ